MVLIRFDTYQSRAAKKDHLGPSSTRNGLYERPNTAGQRLSLELRVIPSHEKINGRKRDELSSFPDNVHLVGQVGTTGVKAEIPMTNFKAGAVSSVPCRMLHFKIKTKSRLTNSPSESSVNRVCDE